MSDDDGRLCDSCKHYGVKTVMRKEIWVEYDDDQNEIWGYEYICPKCGRTDKY